MRNRETDGQLQVTAAVGLLLFSRLVQWDEASAKFTAVSRDSFESGWRKGVDPIFGRLICWINFSAGAEFLAKGVCLLNGVEIRKPQAGATNFGTLGDLTGEKPKHDALKQLFHIVEAGEDQQRLILDSYKYLAREIRNRDAHAYVPNVRNDNFDDVCRRFIPCFNLLSSWLPTGERAISNWREDALHLIGGTLT